MRAPRRKLEFPPLPALSGVVRAVYFEPIALSGERYCIAIVGQTDGGEAIARSTVSPRVARCVIGELGANLAGFSQLVVRDFKIALQAGMALKKWRPPFDRMSLSDPREMDGNDGDQMLHAASINFALLAHEANMIIHTIGYEGIDIACFLSLLREHDIKTVADVRELPLSRKPGFSKKALADMLGLNGFEYVHLPDLGCPKPIRNRYRADGNWTRYKEGFLKYLGTQDEVIADLTSKATTSNCALLCFEADYNYCHRSMVADAVKQLSGMRVCHIQAAGLKKTKSADLALAAA